MAIKIILQIIAVLLLIGVALFIFEFVSNLTGPKEVPSDFELEYGWGDCHMDRGWHNLVIQPKEDAKLGLDQGMFYQEKEYSFSSEELSEIYDKVIDNNFFELEEEYYNPNIRDGSCSVLRIKAEEKEHAVSIANEDVRQVNNIAKKILEILESKDSDWQTLDKAESCQEAATACQSMDSFRAVPCEIWVDVCQVQVTD